MTRPLYQALASKVSARIHCATTGKDEWLLRHRDDADALVRERMPSGSGFDNGTTLDWDKSTGEKLVFNTAFHHMDEHGGYIGWTEHTVTVKPSLMSGIDLTISGRDRRQIKEYIHECYYLALTLPEPEAPAQEAA
jgi:hypothetical protein